MSQTDNQNEIKDKDILKILSEIAKERSTTKTQFWGTILGISVGALFCICGLVIAILGLNGSIEWVLEAGSLKSKLANAGPGVFFALLGMLILWKYKPEGRDTLSLGPFHSDIVIKMRPYPLRKFDKNIKFSKEEDESNIESKNKDN